jgi:hypothetical protein
MAVAVKRPHRAGAQLVARGEDAERVELRHLPPGDRVVEAAGDRDVGLAAAYRPVGAPDCVHPGLGGAGEVGVGAHQPKGLGDVEERRSLESLEEEQRAHAAGELLPEPCGGHVAVLVAGGHGRVGHAVGVADLLVPACEERVPALGVLAQFEPRVAHGEHGSDGAEQVVAGHRAQRAPVRDELPAVDLGRLPAEAGAQRARVVRADLTHA